jgi:serine/threonine protein kinase
MNTEEALKTLNLPATCSPGVVEAAAQALTQETADKRDRAPTPQLKAKFEALLERIAQARHALLVQSAVLGGGSAGSPLSNTKMADLPKAQATGAGLGAGFVATLPSGAAVTWGQAPGQAQAASLREGQLLAARYEIQQLIGTGGMGAVYRAFDKNRDKDIAIKVLLPHLLSHAKAVERFINEARLSSEMSHPHIVNVFDVQQEGGLCFLTMELLQGQTLREWLKQKSEFKQKLGVDEAVAISMQVADALAYAHEKTVHRDIKPENIWITSQGKAKVMDFGIARLLNSTQDAKTQMGVGTAYYMAPEQLIGNGNIDGRADQYATAVMLYEMLAGHVPMGRAESLRSVRKDVPKHVSDAVDTALSPKPEKRFATMQAFKQALGKAGSLPVPSAAGLLGNTKVHIALAVVVAAAAAPFAWQYLNKNQQLKQDYATLDGQTHALQKQADNRLRELEADAANLEREQDKLQGELRQGSSPAATARLRELKTALPLARQQAEQYKQALNADDGLMAVEGFFKEAEAHQRSNDFERATQALHQAKAALRKVMAVPATIKAQDAAVIAVLGQMQGNWSLGPCNASQAKGHVRFDERQALLAAWNGGPESSEAVRAINGQARSVETTDSSGGAFVYTLQRDSQLDVFNKQKSEHTQLTRCP